MRLVDAIKRFVKGEPVVLIGIITAVEAIETQVVVVATGLSALLARLFVTPVTR